MSSTANADPSTPIEQLPPEAESPAAYTRESTLVNVGWVGTALSLAIVDLPLSFLLKDHMRMTPEQIAAFQTIGKSPSYIKPILGILSDAIPLFGTRRYHYLLLSLFLGGSLYVALAYVPKVWGVLLPTYFVLFACLNLTSTVLGGVMVDIGKRFHATGRLSAQRHGINQFVQVVSGPLGGWLANLPFAITGWICAALHFILIPFYGTQMREPRKAVRDDELLQRVGGQFGALYRSRTLWAAAGLIILVVAAPGFKTPLLFYQTDELGFDKQFIGNLGVVKSLAGMAAAVVYGLFCRRLTLRQILSYSIIFHAVMTLWYLAYSSRTAALIIEGVEAATMVWALLPLYDLAARATPKGSEALGYSVMMSVWNFTIQLSDLAGAALTTRLGLHFHSLVWINAITTLLVVIAVPFLPAVLVDRPDGAPEQRPAIG